MIFHVLEVAKADTEFETRFDESAIAAEIKRPDFSEELSRPFGELVLSEVPVTTAEHEQTIGQIPLNAVLSERGEK